MGDRQGSGLILTQGVFNFIRLARLLDFTKIPLICLLEAEESLRSLLSRKRKCLDKLVQNNKIFQDENIILKKIENAEGPADLSSLDVRLLCVLVRNIGSVPGPKKGWNRTGLRADDKSKGADVLRIGNIRNECHHLPSTSSITTEKFDEIYPELKKVLIRLVKGTPNERDFQSLVSELDDPGFVQRQINVRTILEKVTQKWRLNTRSGSSDENTCTDNDDSRDEDIDNESDEFKKICFANDVDSVKGKLDSLTPETIHDGISIACRRGYDEMFRILVDKYSLLNHIDLRNACQGGSSEIVSIILQKLDPRTLENHVKIGSGRCCIHLAADLGFNAIVDCLIQKTPRVLMAVDKAYNTAMHFACMRGHTDVMETILKAGKIQVNDVNGRGQTPLHFAAYFGQVSAVRFLVANGADKNFKDRNRKCAADWCSRGKEQSLQFSWYDPELHIWPTSYGSQEDYEQIIKILQG